MEGYDFNGTYYIPPNGAVFFNGTYQDEADIDLSKLLPSIRFIVKMGLMIIICTFHFLILIRNNIIRSEENQHVYKEFGDKVTDVVDKFKHLDTLIPSPWLFKYTLIFALCIVFLAMILLVFVIIHNCMKCCYKRQEKKRQKRMGIKVTGKMGPPPKPNPSPTPTPIKPKPNATGEQEQVCEIYTNVNVTEDTVNKTQMGDPVKSKSTSVKSKPKSEVDASVQDTNLKTDLQMK